MKPKAIFIILPLTIFLFSGCGLIKKPITTNNRGTLSFVDDETGDVLNFNALYYDAIKADIVEKNPTKALLKLQRCLSIEPQNTAVMFKMGEIYFKQGRNIDAQKILEKATSIDKKNKWYWLLLSDVYKDQKNYNKAIVTYENLIKLEPNNLFYLNDLANLHLLNNDASKAIKVYDEMESNFGIQPEISIQKQKIYISQNKFDQAIEEIKKLVETYPEEPEYLKMLIDVSVAMGKDKDVPLYFEKLLEIDSTDGETQLSLAEYYYRNHNPNAFKTLTKAFENESIDASNKISFLALFFLDKNIKEQKDTLMTLSDILIKTHPGSAKAYALKGDLYSSDEDYKNAVECYKKSLKIDQGVLLMWQKAMSIEIDLGNYSQADSLANEAQNYFPNSPTIYLYQGMANLRLKNYEKSIEVLKEGLDYVFDDNKIKFQFYTNLGEAYNSIRSYAKSDESFEAALKIDPNDLFVLNNYAYYLSLRKDKLEDALEMSKKTIEKDPENPAYSDTYGWILYLNGDFENAEKYIGKALQAKKWDPEILEHYGDCLYKLNKIEDALIYWEKAKKKGSTSPYIDKKIEEKKLYE